jgi:predicted nuclease of predicted toxin-antitoxin system
VATAAELRLACAADEDLLRAARHEGRILVTRDRDYGNLVFVQKEAWGVIYLRMRPATQAAVHAELSRVLSGYGEDRLRSSFVVVEPMRHRTRTLHHRP